MNTTIFSLIAVLLYLVTAARIALPLWRSRVDTPASLALNFGLALAALALHAGSLYHSLLTPAGINLGVFNTFSLVTWLVAVILVGSALFRPLANLAVAVFPCAALAIVLDMLFPSRRILPEEMPRGLDLHIALSLVAYSILTIAALQAAVIAVADHQLRHKRPLKVMRVLPPLTTMETLLFQLLGIGLFLLSLGLISGFMFVHNLFAQHLVHKTVLSVLAWFVFALLLWGRRYRGWRGRTAVRYTLAGFILLMLAFFGSAVVLQLVLHRV